MNNEFNAVLGDEVRIKGTGVFGGARGKVTTVMGNLLGVTLEGENTETDFSQREVTRLR